MKNEKMWKIGIILCVAIFILVTGDAPEVTLNSVEVMRTLDSAKEQIHEIMKGVYWRGLGYGEEGKNDLANYTETIRRELNEEITEIHKEINKLYQNLSDAIKEDCNEFTDGMYEKEMIIDETMSDCILHTVAGATEKLAHAFSSASYGITMLEFARDLVKACDTVKDCDMRQLDILGYRDEAVTQLTAAHKEYVEQIGNRQIFNKCINEDVDLSLAAFSDYLSKVVRDTQSCIAKWQ